MLKSLFCKDISVEYEFKSVKFRGVIDRLKMKTQRKSGNTTDFKTFFTDAPTFASIYIDLYIRDGICQNLSF